MALQVHTMLFINDSRIIRIPPNLTSLFIQEILKVFTTDQDVFAAFERTETVEMLGKLKSRPVSDPTPTRLFLNELKSLSGFEDMLSAIRKRGGVAISDIPLLKLNMPFWHPAFQQFSSDLPSMPALQAGSEEELMKVSQAAFDKWSRV